MKRNSVLSNRYIPMVFLVLILVVSAYLRLYKISEYMTFLGDEGRDMLVMKHMIMDHKFTLLGPTASVGGFFLGPIYYYFMLPFVWVWRMDPSGAAVMVALFGIATVYLVYRIGRDWFGERVGLIASALYALSPVVIAYSRSSWNPNLVPFFSSLTVYLLWKSVVEKKPALLFLIGVALGIGLQLHYLFLFLFPVVGLWYLLYGREKQWLPYYALGILGFLVGYGPFLIFELRHGFPNTIAIYRFLQEGQGTGFVLSNFWKNITDVTYRIFGRLVYRHPPGEQMATIVSQYRMAWSAGTMTGIIGAVGISLAALMGRLPYPVSPKQKTGTRLAFILLMLWILIPVVLFGFYKKGIYDYYFGIVFVVPFLFTAVILHALSKWKIGAMVAIAVFAGLVWLNWEGRPFKFPPNNQLAQARMIAAQALEKTDGKPFNFALMTGGNSDHAYRYFFEIWGRAPVEIENFDVDPNRASVTDQLIVICEMSDCKPLGASLWEIAGFGRAEITGEWSVSFVKIMRLVHYKEVQK